MKLKRFLTLIFFTALLVGIFALTTACSSEEPEADKDESCRIVILLETPSSDEQGRSALAGGQTRAGEESLIEEERVKNMSLFILTDDNTSFPIVSRYLGNEDGKFRYEATLQVSSDYVTYDRTTGKYYLTGRMAAVANMPENPHPHPLEQRAFPLEQLAERGVIPMWGVTMISDLEVRPGDRLDVGTTIEMLRSVPKFTFRLAPEISDEYVISEVTASTDDFSLSAYCQPGAAKEAFKTGGMTKDEWFNPVMEDATRGSDFIIRGLGSAEVSLFTGERTLDAATADKRYFNITLFRKDYPGEEIKGRIYLCDYRMGAVDPNRYFTRLVRNHDYQYEISLAKLEMLISFKEWIYGGKVHIELE